MSNNCDSCYVKADKKVCSYVKSEKKYFSLVMFSVTVLLIYGFTDCADCTDWGPSGPFRQSVVRKLEFQILRSMKSNLRIEQAGQDV